MATPRIAIIGAGFSGIGMAVKLIRDGIGSFTIYDRLPDAGGCWRSNNFPGAEVDTESDVYRFSFKSYPWTRSHARRDELLRYFDDVIDEYGLRRHIQFNTTIVSVVWNEEALRYTLTTTQGATYDAEIVISAVGLFSEPKIPTWPGLDRFEGDIVHTAQWRNGLDLSGRDVAVVGTGSTGASLVPAVAEIANRLYVFQRQPGWILPKPVTEYDELERYRRAGRLTSQWSRARALYRIRKAIKGGRAKKVGTAQNQAVERVVRDFLNSSLDDRPDLIEQVTPDYPVYGKRLVRSSDFYPALKRPNVELVPREVRKVTPHALVDDMGVERNVDVIVFATGFKASQFLSGLRVVGRQGTDLHEDVWKDDASAFLGMVVPNFPNFFVLYGPNTNGSGAHLFVLECQMSFVGGIIKRMQRSGTNVAEVRPKHFHAYERWLRKQWVDSALLTTHNYFRGASGNVVTNWPRGFGLYFLLTKFGRFRSVHLTALSRRDPACEVRKSGQFR
jgi:cation diffusion facilitator CzcD-associated flavoprotein CzcO